jgi:hypothetical protein
MYLTILEFANKSVVAVEHGPFVDVPAFPQIRELLEARYPAAYAVQNDDPLFFGRKLGERLQRQRVQR